MTTPQLPRKAHLADRVATVLLATVSFAGGVLLGALYLLFLPVQIWWPWWVVLCVGMMVAGVSTAFVGIYRLRRARLAFWVPLVGIGTIVVLMFVLGLLVASIQPVLPPR